MPPEPGLRRRAATLEQHKANQARERDHAEDLWTEGDWVFTGEPGSTISRRTDWDRWNQLL